MADPDHRLFFAFCPDAPSALRIGALASRLRTELSLKGQPHELQRLHVTLHHLGDFVGMPERERAAAEAAAQGVVAEPVVMRFDHVLSFENQSRRSRPLVLGGGQGLDGVCEFRRRLGEALKAAGLKVDSRYTPHLTLLYDDQLVPRQAIEPLGWTAGELVLIDSLLGQARHVPLARWPLRTAAQP